MADAKTLIPEEVIVALTAIYQVCPQLLTSKHSPLFVDNEVDRSKFDEKLIAEAEGFIAKHNALASDTASNGKPFAPFPKYRREIEPFLAIVGEFQAEVQEAPPRSAAA
jgi:hypothetical protein